NADVTQVLYADHSDENHLNWNIGANGVLDITRRTQIAAGLRYAQLHEDRGEPNSPAAASEPTKYSLFSGNLSALQRFNRLFVKLTGEFDDYAYDDVTNLVGGIIDQSPRDYIETRGILRVGYDVSPDTNVY